MANLSFYAAICSDVGKVRKNNEDNFSLLGKVLPEEAYFGRFAQRSELTHEGVVAVFDGMGGVSNGELASMEAARLTARFREKLLTLSADSVREFAHTANAAICEKIENMDAQMGATMTVAAIRDGHCTVGNIGDSRIYLLHEGTLTQLSVDHTVAAQMVRMNLLTKETAKADKRKHQLTQHLGIPSDVMEIQPNVQENLTLFAGDRLLFCSDGVTDALSDDDLKTLLSQETSCEKMAGGIVDSAILGGSPDNVTALVVKIGWERERRGTEAYSSDFETTLSLEPPKRAAGKSYDVKRGRLKDLSASLALQNSILILSGLLGLTLGAVAALIL